MRVVHKEHRDTRLNEDISKIVNIVIEHIPIKTFTLVLYGGYGRNEGGFFFDIDTILPYNDYDVLIITERTLDELTINKITRKVLNDINIKWFDLSVKNLRELQNLRNSIWSYDLKNGSKVIYGNKEILKLVDNFNPSNVEPLMCRHLISVDWQGYVYDCDFNQMLEMPLALTGRKQLWEINANQLKNAPISVAKHCFGCTAGAGSSCSGALTRHP